MDKNTVDDAFLYTVKWISIICAVLGGIGVLVLSASLFISLVVTNG